SPESAGDPHPRPLCAFARDSPITDDDLQKSPDSSGDPDLRPLSAFARDSRFAYENDPSHRIYFQKHSMPKSLIFLLICYLFAGVNSTSGQSYERAAGLKL